MGVPAQPNTQVAIRDFTGLQDNNDPHDPQPGAGEIQTNAACLRMGELTIRHGYKVVQFD